MTSGRARVGCSGWSYKDWRETVYGPEVPAREWLSHYARLFSTVEVNNTFYRLPSAETFSGWKEKAPAGFIFSVKVSRYGTHRLRLRDPGRWLPNYLSGANLLGEHLGPNLVQLPPRWKRNLERLSEFLAFVAETDRAGSTGGRKKAPRGAKAEGGHKWAVEFRDPSWLHESTYELLADNGVALCCHDMLEDHPWILTTGWGYARFHGPVAGTAAGNYSGEYGKARLAAPSKLLRSWLDNGSDVYVYFNNDVGGAAVRDATCMARLLA
ncbi:MAG TPA: DUF72 domain-containing protein [Acidimicrobiales bacterium]|nr:DUF72 domain-containing protein [Acidimicrobiales bacterium]